MPAVPPQDPIVDPCVPTDAPDGTGSNSDRTELWLDLLKTLTERYQGWLVLKHPESGFVGDGDIDSAAPRESWEAIADTFRQWARDSELGAVIECPHAPGWLHLIALDPGGDRFWELDVNERKLMLGSTFYAAEDLNGLSVMDPRGFRRLRPGAEGLIKLIHNGTRRGGRPNPEGIRTKGIPRLLEADPEGVRMAAQLYGRAGPFAIRGATACVAGGWDRAAMVAVEARFAARAIARPSGVVWRLRSRHVRRADPVLAAVFTGKRRPIGSEESWLRHVRKDHRVDERPPVTPA